MKRKDVQLEVKNVQLEVQKKNPDRAPHSMEDWESRSDRGVQ